MINRNSTAAILIAELAMIAVALALNIINPTALVPLSEMVLIGLTFVNLGLFYNFTVQKKMDTIATTLFIQFVVVNIATLSQVLTASPGLVFPIVATIACCANILLVSLVDEDTHVRTERIELRVPQPIEVEHPQPTTVILPETQSTTSLVAREAEIARLQEIDLQPQSKTLNQQIVNVAAPQQAASLDESKLDDLKKADEKIAEEIKGVNVKVDEKIEKVGEKVSEELTDVKKELADLKKKEKKLFVASTGGKKLHNPTCMIAQRIPKEKRIMIEDMEQAVQDGYTPCGVCCPVQTLTVEN